MLTVILLLTEYLLSQSFVTVARMITPIQWQGHLWLVMQRAALSVLRGIAACDLRIYCQ